LWQHGTVLVPVWYKPMCVVPYTDRWAFQVSSQLAPLAGANAGRAACVTPDERTLNTCTISFDHDEYTSTTPTD